MDQYLKRIAFPEDHITEPERSLKDLHYQHLVNVPFEDLSIHHRQPIELDAEKLHKKVVIRNRGGFCYELNFMFYHLLRSLGYRVHMISARIFDEQGIPGPEYDHMALLAELDDLWLCDVGFGDLFLIPLRMKCNEPVFDGRKWYMIKPAGDEYLLLESKDKKHFEKKYLFTIRARDIEDFHEQCLWKQNHPDSYFVKNKICTIPTSEGRKTIFNDKLIIKSGDSRSQTTIRDSRQENEILHREFGIFIG